MCATGRWSVALVLFLLSFTGCFLWDDGDGEPGESIGDVGDTAPDLGGEVAALAIVEAVARLLPGVVGNEESITDDSFAPGSMEGLLEGPVYTRPQEWRGHEVPEVLLSGDHARIAAWQREQAIARTQQMRSDLGG